MDLQSFKDSVEKSEPPKGLSSALEALWWDAKGDWEKAHHCAQERDDDAGMQVHAYLHRKEGDLSNADYWYRRCRKTPAKVSLAEEWDSLAQALLPTRLAAPRDLSPLTGRHVIVRATRLTGKW